jgi:hypothetical protein
MASVEEERRAVRAEAAELTAYAARLQAQSAEVAQASAEVRALQVSKAPVPVHECRASPLLTAARRKALCIEPMWGCSHYV